MTAGKREKREKEGELATTSLEFEFHLQFPCGWVVKFLPVSGKRKGRKSWTNIEKHVPRVMMSLLMSSPPISISHRLFRCRYSNFRDAVASSPSFSRAAASVPRRAPSQATFLIKWNTWTVNVRISTLLKISDPFRIIPPPPPPLKRKKKLPNY